MTRVRLGKNQIEVLAPAGSYESFKAAISAGADAVYAGGPRFGARAFADNFTEEMLLEAIDYAHLHGRKFYLTVNTLLKDAETAKLYDYLEPLYRQGLDAVIVQDIGVLEFVRTHFPDMDIHASTQMTVTNAEGALFLKEQGVRRVVPARELSLAEVRKMHDITGMEIECFVHGALCYCYSGQCLLSSLIGGRSGNRGQCAQPCRLPYTVNGKKEYVLSLKDICTLELIPKLAEAGICSFKIEGRMKKPEYVALVTSIYRKYVDLYLQKGGQAFLVHEQDKERLLDIYNRGGFSEGYYRQHNGRDMLSLRRPNHAGVPAVKVISQKGREITGELLTDIHKGDVLELKREQDKADTKDNYTFGKSIAKGSRVHLLVPRGKNYSKGTLLYRIRNQELLDSVKEAYVGGSVQEPVTGYFKADVGQRAVLTVSYGSLSVSAATEENTEGAKNQALDEARLKKQIQKTGNTEFFFDRLDIEIGGAIFLPMQRINELRRKALELLESTICGQYHRKTGGGLPGQVGIESTAITELCQKSGDSFLSVLAETSQQMNAAINEPCVSRIYMDCNIGTDFLQDRALRLLCSKCKEQGKEIFFAMPHIFRENALTFFTGQYEAFQSFGFDGVLVRNYESFHFLKEHGFDKKVILDHNLYVFNQSAKQFWAAQGITSFTAPVELDEGELAGLGVSGGELIVYGRLPVMVSAQCITKTTGGCTRKPEILKMKDRYQKEFPVKNCCNFCYNVVYHTVPLYLIDLKESIKELAPAGLRVSFTQEDEQEASDILKRCRSFFTEDGSSSTVEMEITRGHFKRGII